MIIILTYYRRAVSRKFRSVVGEPAWAKLDRGDLQNCQLKFVQPYIDSLKQEKSPNLPLLMYYRCKAQCTNLNCSGVLMVR